MPTLLHTSRTARTLFNIVNAMWVLGELRIRASRPAHTGQVGSRTNLTSRVVIFAGIGGGLFGSWRLVPGVW